ncbi:Bro-N domain-containing protein [Lactobacillus iners]|uniref:BRO-N domain-containing protein n=1 Tax=Lactobacillus iners TaxID=147802 RepID=UPI0039A73590
MINNNEIQIFNFENNEIRTKIIDNEPYFNLTDACKILEIKNPLRSKERLLDTQGIYGAFAFTLMGYEETDFISETNLYRLISQSRKPEAEKFKHWVISDVLPFFTQDKVAKKMIHTLEELRRIQKELRFEIK